MTREKQQESPHIRRHLGEVSARLVPTPPIPTPSARRGGGGMKKVPRRREEVTSSPRERSCGLECASAPVSPPSLLLRILKSTFIPSSSD